MNVHKVVQAAVALLLISSLLASIQPVASTQMLVSYEGDYGIVSYGRPQIIDDRYLYYLYEDIPGTSDTLGLYYLYRMDLTSGRETLQHTFETPNEIVILDNGAIYATLHGDGFYAFYWNIKDRYRKDMILKSAEGHDDYYLCYTLKTATYKQVYVYNVVKSTSTMVTTNNANHEDPRMSGDTVVFTQYNDDYDLYMVNKSGGMMVPLSTMTGDEETPLISGNDVAYMLTKGSSHALYYVDVNARDPVLITNSVGNYTVNEGRILFYDTSYQEWFVYFIDEDSVAACGITGNVDEVAVSEQWGVIGSHVVSFSEGTPITTAPPTTVAPTTTPAPTTAPPTTVAPTTLPPTTVAPTTTPAPTTAPPTTAAPTPLPVDEDIVTEEILITNAPGEQIKPHVYDDIIVWTDKRSDDGDIYMYDLGRSREVSVSATSGEQGSPVRIWGNYVVWHDNESGGWNINIYDIAAKEVSELVGSSGTQAFPVCYGRYVVYHDRRSSTWDIYGYDMDEDEEFSICTEAGDQNRPDIYGTIVVWDDMRSGNKDIYGYDLESGEEFVICDNGSEQSSPRICGDIVVWHDDRNGTWDIYGYNLKTEEEFAICTADGTQSNASLNGDIVVWHDNRTGDWDIYGYNLDTEEEFSICVESGMQSYPDVYGNVVVWEDMRSGEKNIYAAYLNIEASEPDDEGGSGGVSVLIIVAAVVVVGVIGAAAVFMKKRGE
jgi:beta propeller repeat protein